MAEKMNITIVGLGLIGASAGLALRRYADRVTVIGHDRDTGLANRAKSAGAVERTEWNLINAVSRADRVLLALPLGEIRDTLKAIAQDLKPGCLLLDTASIKAPVLAWAAELLPANVSLVGGHPIVLADPTDPTAASADLFTDKLFCLTPPARADDAAVRLAADLVEALGAKPFFVDVTEHDGMAAAVEHVPALLAAALLSATSRSSGWSDMRKLAATQYFASTFMAEGDPATMMAAVRANRAHVTRWLDILINALADWRERLGEDDDPRAGESLAAGQAARQAWLSAQRTGQWEEATSSMSDVQGMGASLGQLIGLGRARLPADKRKR
jgi:prephenate dehydrogenase